jgi:hypothetical protein
MRIEKRPIPEPSLGKSPDVSPFYDAEKAIVSPRTIGDKPDATESVATSKATSKVELAGLP